MEKNWGDTPSATLKIRSHVVYFSSLFDCPTPENLWSVPDGTDRI